MKAIFSRIKSEEKGAVFLLALILLGVGSLILAPLLSYMSTGLMATKVFEDETKDFYAADAGVEDAIWRLINNGEGLVDITDPENPKYGLPTQDQGDHTRNYTIADVNDRSVTITIWYLDGITYRIESVASSPDGASKVITAFVDYFPGGAVGDGGLGGGFSQNKDTKGLCLISADTFIFTTDTPNSYFQGREDPDFGSGFGPSDLWLLNMATGTSASFLDSASLGLGTNYAISGIHYYREVDDYLLLCVEDNGTIGSTTFSNSDIIKMQVDIDWSSDPDHPRVTAVNGYEVLYTVSGADLISLSRKANGNILFSLHTDSVIGGRAQVLEYNPSDGTSQMLFDADITLPGNPNLELDALSVLPAPDNRILLSFTVDPVTGSNGQQIKDEDIAVWNPADNTIVLYIGMDDQGGMVSQPIYFIFTRSWQVS